MTQTFASGLLQTIRTDDDLLNVSHAFRDLVEARNLLQQAVSVGVEAMRGRGASWGEIARALGVSRQAAQQMYGRSERR